MHGTLEMLASSGWVTGLAGVAVRGAWESMVIAAFLSALMRWVPGLSPKAGFRLWAAGFLLAALLPLCRAGLRFGHPLSAIPGAGAHAALPLVSLPVGLAAGLCALWMGVSSVALVRFGAGVWSLGRLLRAADPAPLAVRAMYLELTSRGGRASGARLLVAGGIGAPSACGLFGASILLPRGLVESLSPDELGGVLRHEAAHLCRWDDWLTVLARLLRVALPFALAMPYLERRMAQAREMACDDDALHPGASRPISRRAYAACLARLAESAGTERWRALAPGLGGEGSQLEARVGHILRGGTVRGPGWVRLAAAGCAGALLTAALLAAPSFLSFGGAGSGRAETAHGMQPPASASAAAMPQARPIGTVRPARWRPERGGRRTPAHVAAASRQFRAPSPRTTAPAVLVLWTERQGVPGEHLILLVTHPQRGPAAIWSNVFLLTT